MKTTIFCGALAVSLAASTGYGQSVEEMLGFTVPGMQTPSVPTETEHATAEDSPFYVTFAFTPVVQGSTHLQDSVAAAGTTMTNGQVKFDVGIGFDITFGWRIPDTYIILQISAGFNWSPVKEFNADLDAAGIVRQLHSDEGNQYQVPILFSPGLEFDLPGGWPFLHGGVLRFGPTIGITYQDLKVSDISRSGFPNESYSFGSSSWVFAYGGFVSLDFFLSYNIALAIGYQFMGTSPLDYNTLQADGLAASVAPEMKTNFTFTNIVKCGVSIYF